MIVAGVDESGRGPLAGPVVAAAVVLDEKITIEGLRDSKKLTSSQRISLSKIIKVKATACSTSIVGVKVIDAINILEATLLAMKSAVEALEIKPEKVMIDGINAPILDIPSETIIKGDTFVESIMAASIIAKVTRDLVMINLDKFHPNYQFNRNKGYPTKDHINALQIHGPCVHHRVTFKPVKKYLNKKNKKT